MTYSYGCNDIVEITKGKRAVAGATVDDSNGENNDKKSIGSHIGDEVVFRASFAAIAI